MEKYIIEETECYKILEEYIPSLKLKKISNILDFVSNEISLTFLLKYFENAHIEALIYPEKNDLDELLELENERVTIVKRDIVINPKDGKYDLVLLQRSFTRVLQEEYDTVDAVNQMLRFESNYYVILDFEEISYNFPEIRNRILLKEYEIILDKEIIRTIELEELEHKSYRLLVFRKRL